MISVKRGMVKEILSEWEESSLVEVEYDGEVHKAMNYRSISGDIKCGDVVYVNVTANTLKLGTGGYDFVMVNTALGDNLNTGGSCDIMKMKYIPCQAGFEYIKPEGNFEGLMGCPVLIGELHSMLPAAACCLKYQKKDIKIAYIMTDGGCLAAGFSNIIRELKAKKIIDLSITYGNSFGGDMEAVNIYDALVMAKTAECDIIIVSMGPGSLGTGTKYGFSGIEQGFIIDASNSLGGTPVFIPRISFRDERQRHFGLSHHSITVLSEVADTKASVVIPKLGSPNMEIIMSQISKNNISHKHNIVIIDSDIVFQALRYYNVDVSTMGRGLYEDREFFITCGCAALYAASILK